jgi:hypothetical protein
MAGRIRIKIGDGELQARLNESETAELLYRRLPLSLSMSRWGDEYYGDCGLSAGLADDARAEMEVGELAFWPQGSALCIFFGPTPASVDEKPRAVSAVNPIGMIESGIDLLESLPASIDIRVEAL